MDYRGTHHQSLFDFGQNTQPGTSRRLLAEHGPRSRYLLGVRPPEDMP